MRELMRKFREKKLPTLERYKDGKYNIRLVHIESKSHFFYGDAWRAIVNKETTEEALQSLREQLQDIEEALKDDTFSVGAGNSNFRGLGRFGSK